MSTTEDQDEGRKGVVVVINAHGATARDMVDKTEMTNYMGVIQSLPVRIASIHYCHDDPTIHKPLLNILVTGLDDNSRTRFREHVGKLFHDSGRVRYFPHLGCLPQCVLISMRLRTLCLSLIGDAEDCKATLKCFGIPSTEIQHVNQFSLENLAHHRHWLERRRELDSKASGSGTDERNDTTRQVSDTYEQHDVLFGRGRGIQSHPGNRKCRELVGASLERYEEGDRLVKTRLAEEIVRRVKDSSGRFLKEKDGKWLEVDNNTAREKVAHTFRTLRKSILQNAEEASSQANGEEEDI